MERNARLYECAKRLVDAGRILLPFDTDIKEQILDIATLITQRIVVDEKEIGEIEKYEQQLKG
jgi:hypothetical protein